MQAPFVSRLVANGTFRKVCERRPLDNRISLGGRPEERRLAREIARPHASPENGARIGPTEAMPSVAKSDALKLPKLIGSFHHDRQRIAVRAVGERFEKRDLAKQRDIVRREEVIIEVERDGGNGDHPEIDGAEIVPDHLDMEASPT